MAASSIDNQMQSQRLIKELRTLRKGSGLTSWKLAKTHDLRLAIAIRLSGNPLSLTAVQAMDYLVSVCHSLGDSVEARALRNAFAINATDGEAPARSLADRRNSFAAQLGRHPDTIEAYENKSIAETAQRLLSTDAAVPDSSHRSRTTAESIATTSDAAKLMLGHGLDALYGLGSRAPEVLKNFEVGRTPFLDTNVEVRLRQSSKGSGWFSYEVRYVFSATVITYRIGVTERTHETEILLASGLVDDVMQLNPSDDLSATAAGLMDSTRLTALEPQSPAVHELPFQEISQSDREQYAQNLWQLPADKFRIYTATIPPGISGKPGVRYEFTQKCDLSAKDPYAFWYSPGIMYLNNLLVDTSQFQPTPATRFIIQPFLGKLMPGALDATQRSLSIAANGWVMQGNGLAIFWTES